MTTTRTDALTAMGKWRGPRTAGDPPTHHQTMAQTPRLLETATPTLCALRPDDRL